MQVDSSAAAAHRLAARFAITGGLLAASIVGNLIMGLIVVGSRQTILVPMLPASVTLSAAGAVSYDYLEAVARDAAYLFLNRTPDNNDYFEQQLLKIAEPETYQAIRAELSDQRRHTLSGHVTQTWIPSDWYVNTQKLYVELSGTLNTSNGTERGESVPKIYAIRFTRHGSALRLASFVSINREQSLGQKVQVTPPPPPAIVPLSNMTETP